MDDFNFEIAKLVADESRSLSAVEQLRLALKQIERHQNALLYVARFALASLPDISSDHIEITRLCGTLLPEGWQP